MIIHEVVVEHPMQAKAQVQGALLMFVYSWHALATASLHHLLTPLMSSTGFGAANMKLRVDIYDPSGSTLFISLSLSRSLTALHACTPMVLASQHLSLSFVEGI